MKLPIIGQNNGVGPSGLSKDQVSQLKKTSQKASSVADALMAKLRDLDNNYALTPDDIQLFQEQINRLDTRGRRVAQKLYNNAVYNTIFPIMRDLYGRN